MIKTKFMNDKLSPDIKTNDINFGVNQESYIQKQAELYFDIKLNKTKNKFNVIDYFNDKYLIELKCRRCYRMAYDTTMIGQNKIDAMKNGLTNGMKCICLFNFINGLYYYEITKDSILNIEENMFGGRSDRGDNEYKKSGYSYIPTKLLTKINIDQYI